MASSRTYSAEQAEFIRENYPKMPTADLAAAFNDRFGESKSVRAIGSYGKRMGLYKNPGVREEAIRKSLGYVKYTDEWREWFKGYSEGHSSSEMHEESMRLFGIPLSKSKVSGWRNRLGVRANKRFGVFEPGHETWNKGKTWDELGIPEESRERSLSKAFKKGEVRKTRLIKDVGYERVSKDGYVEVKVKDGVQGGHNDNYRMKHHIEFERHHGEIPDGHNVVFADRDKRNFAADNLVAVPRSLWAVIRNQRIEYHDRESLLEAMELARLQSLANAIECARHVCAACGSTFTARYPKQRTCDACLETRKAGKDG